MLPAYVANAVPILLARFKIWEFLNVPVDFNFHCKGEAFFGKTKTYRGIIGGTLAGMLMIFLQTLIYKYFGDLRWLYIFEYIFPNILFLGFLMGFGLGLGDLVKSFFKRRLHIDSTKPFVPFDQMDFLGAVVLSYFFYNLGTDHLLAILIISPALPVAANIVAYKFGWKKVWW